MQVNVQPVYVPGLQGEATASGAGDAASNNNIIQVQQQLDFIVLQTCGMSCAWVSTSAWFSVSFQLYVRHHI